MRVLAMDSQTLPHFKQVALTLECVPLYDEGSTEIVGSIHRRIDEYEGRGTWYVQASYHDSHEVARG